MPETAVLVQANLPQFCPVTNLYRGSDDTYWLVTIPSIDVVGTLVHFGIQVPITRAHLPTQVDVFSADADANVLDWDGDPSNGMTPINSFEAVTHAEALAAIGYTVI